MTSAHAVASQLSLAPSGGSHGGNGINEKMTSQPQFLRELFLREMLADVYGDADEKCGIGRICQQMIVERAVTRGGDQIGPAKIVVRCGIAEVIFDV